MAQLLSLALCGRKMSALGSLYCVLSLLCNVLCAPGWRNSTQESPLLLLWLMYSHARPVHEVADWVKMAMLMA